MKFRKRVLASLGAVSAAAVLAIAVHAAEEKEARAGASATPAGKIGVVNVERVSRESLRMRGEIDAAQNKILGISDEFEQKTLQAKSLTEELQRKRSLLTQDEIDRREKEILELRDQLESIDAKAEREFKRTEGTIRREMARSLREAADRLGRDGGFDLLLASDTVLYAGPGVDVTEQLIALIDADLPAVAEAPESTEAAPSAPSTAKQ